MIIRSIQVDRYGAVHNKKLSLEQRLVVVYGPNEAGKSNVMGFIRAALFGFPARSGVEPSRDPWAGMIRLADESGADWQIERREPAVGFARSRSSRNGLVTVTRPDGTQGGEELLQPLVAGISGGQFRSVFAFSLSELQELRSLQSDELNALLYSVGLGMDGRAILAVEKKIAQDMDELYRPRGKNQRMAAVLKSAEAIEAELRESREQQGCYDAMAVELAGLDSRITQAAGQLREHRTELAWLEAAEQAAAHLLQSRAAEAELAQLPEPPAAPAAGALPRFERLAEQLERARAEAARLGAALVDAAERLCRLPAEEAALALRSGMEPLAESLSGYEQDRQSLAVLEQEAKQLEGQLDAVLRQIGEGWSADELDAFPPIVPVREQIRNFRDRLETLHAGQDRNKAALEQYERAYEEALERSDHLWRNMVLRSKEFGVLVDEAASDASIRHIQESLVHFHRSTFNEQLPAIRRLVRQREQWKLEHRLSGGQTEEEHGRSRLKRPAQMTAIPPVLWLSSAASVFGGVLWLMLALRLGSWILAISGFAGFLITAALLLVTGFRSTARSRPSSEQLDGQAPLERMLQDTAKQLHFMWESISALPELSASAAAFSNSKPNVQLPHSPDDLTDEGLERLERLAVHWREAGQELERQFNEWETAAHVSEQNKKLLLREQEKLRENSGQIQSVKQEWTDRLCSLRLSEEISPDTALDIVHQAEQGVQLLYTLRTVYSKRTDVQNRLRQYQETVAQHLGSSAEADPTGAVKAWLRECRAAEERAIVRSRIVLEQEEADRKLEHIRLECEKLNEATLALWVSVGADDEASFFHIMAREERRYKLLEERERAQSLISAILGGRDRETELDTLLNEEGSFGIRVRIEERRGMLERQEQELDIVKDLRSRLSGELEKLEQGATHADKLQRREEQKASLAELTGEWAVLSLAAALIRRTRQLVERERQPVLLQRATAYFREMTGGRFTRVMMPLGEERLLAERASGELIDSALMSRGTAEQLYLAMRFALADEVSHAGKAVLPMVMDDVFVNFDSERLRHTLLVLFRVAEHRQVLYFTCHPHIVDAFRQSEQPFQLIEL